VVIFISWLAIAKSKTNEYVFVDNLGYYLPGLLKIFIVLIHLFFVRTKFVGVSFDIGWA